MLLDVLNLIGLKKKTTTSSEKHSVPNTSRLPLHATLFNADATDSCNTSTVATKTERRSRQSRCNRPSEEIMKFHFEGSFQGRKVHFPLHAPVLSATVIDEKRGGEIGRAIQEGLVEFFSEKNQTTAQERHLLQAFLQEKERAENSRFRLIFPTVSYPVYTRFFIEQRKNNQLLGKFEFFLSEYFKFLHQYDTDRRARSRRRSRSNGRPSTASTSPSTSPIGRLKKGASAPVLEQIRVNSQQRPRSSSSVSLRPRSREREGPALREEILSQIHSRWSKAMGISTSANLDPAFS